MLLLRRKRIEQKEQYPQHFLTEGVKSNTKLAFYHILGKVNKFKQTYGKKLGYGLFVVARRPCRVEKNSFIASNPSVRVMRNVPTGPFLFHCIVPLWPLPYYL